ncbi:MAG: HEPN domain-containing protein [Candidatus Aenigmarchaeota archaeon]|nr:HEPN domain-containing protein [Candidatus Aenigmarchaeota archaeon]
MREDVQAWWGRAERDLDTARYLLSGKRYEDAAVYAQQAAEKALKAVSLRQGKAIRKIHDLVKLGKDVGLPGSLLEQAKELTLAYAYGRYPDVPGAEEIQSIAADFIDSAEEILQWAKRNLA